MVPFHLVCRVTQTSHARWPIRTHTAMRNDDAIALIQWLPIFPTSVKPRRQDARQEHSSVAPAVFALVGTLCATDGLTAMMPLTRSVLSNKQHWDGPAVRRDHSGAS